MTASAGAACHRSGGDGGGLGAEEEEERRGELTLKKDRGHRTLPVSGVGHTSCGEYIRLD